MAAASFLFSCSNDEPILDNPIKPGTALLSLAIDTRDILGTKGITKADTDSTIASLSVFVYDATNGNYLISKTKELKDVTGPLTEVDSIKVNPGSAKVLILANLSESLIGALEGENLSVALSTTTTLQSETMGNFTMSSEVKSVFLKERLYNMMGYTTAQVNSKDNAMSIYRETGDNPAIKLYRTVARIQLMEVALKMEENDFGTPVSITIDSMFLGNVKSESYIASEGKAYLPVEVADDFTSEGWWLYGAHNFWPDRKYKKPVGDNTDLSDALVHEFKKDDNFWLTLDKDKTSHTETDGPVDGKQFFVYENSNADKKAFGANVWTYLVLRGTYRYIDKDGKPQEMKDRFYPIPINPAGSTQTNVLLSGHQGIMRNNSYNISVTLSGIGSDEPWVPTELVNFNVKVVVKDWVGSVNVGGELE